MKRFASLSLLLFLTGNSATASEVMPARDDNSIGSGYGGMTLMMLGSVGGPAGALIGGIAGVFVGGKADQAVRNSMDDSNTTGKVRIGPLEEGDKPYSETGKGSE
ncbi:hypothetical protein [Azomonas macrocytogenes]|uniref:Uncharacterized protein YcfJ n=1 Tax=Azomonas macrocytogenes TaxID=69962 RepID=A0A839T1V2_AZOMA|nr:hypothetical protein [Azomonas macrocytogenes]MBB3103537.1 uncharacterized protein YcfJ [Azomonas macrocytogenes]